MAPKKAAKTAEDQQANTNLGPAIREGELVFG